jgi:hypothetical protein
MTYADYGSVNKNAVWHWLATFEAKGQITVTSHGCGFLLIAGVQGPV